EAWRLQAGRFQATARWRKAAAQIIRQALVRVARLFRSGDSLFPARADGKYIGAHTSWATFANEKRHDHPARPVHLARLADDRAATGPDRRATGRAGRRAAAAEGDRDGQRALAVTPATGRQFGDARDHPRFRWLPWGAVSTALSGAGRSGAGRARHAVAGSCRPGANRRSKARTGSWHLGAAALAVSGSGHSGSAGLDPARTSRIESGSGASVRAGSGAGAAA